jgi:hypothetical protein
MKRILKLLSQLYPSAWRRRYGAEYEALLEERQPRVGDVFDVLWGAVKMQMTTRSFVGIVLPCAIGGALLAIVISLAGPPRYVSQTVFAGESRFDNGVCGNQNDLPAELQGPKPGVCADDATFNRYLEYLRQNAFSRDFLTSVIQRENLYARERVHKPLAAVVDQMQKSIHVKALGQQEDRFHFAVQFDYRDPRIAQQVDRELVFHLFQAGPNGFPLNDPRTKFWNGTDGMASLPESPAGPGWVWFGVWGLFAGLLCGFAIAGILGARHQIVVSKRSQ